MTKPIRLAVVDDHPLFREGVTRSLAEIGDFSVVAEGSSADDAFRIATENRPEILLMDISMPGGGLNALSRILAQVPEQKIVLLTVSEANEHITTALNAGAKGYVLKGVGSRTLADILRSVAAGETYLSPVLSARLLSSLMPTAGGGTPSVDPIRKLTVREAGILEAVGAGLSNKRIANELNLQEKTIKHNMTRIFAKLGVTNRTEAALFIRNAKDRQGE